MRKIVCILAALCLLSLSALPCYGATHKEAGTEDIDVFVTVNYTPVKGEIRATEKNGEYTATTDSGAVISVKPQISAQKLSLVVYPIPTTDKEAYTWFESCGKTFGDHRYYYEIYFVDKSGKRVEAGPCELSLSLPDGYGTPKTAALDKNGTVTELANTVEGSRVKLTMEGNGYYLLAQEAAHTPTPPTGDSGALPLCLLLLAVALGMGVLISKKRA